ncbi:serine protease [Nocardiopsis suaedae]|uniref:Serine protease n=1 Tax=Nocardiopsis suaedae TaxID=3018444 RepID=A0ABT4TP59_9ACTN|nr:serine protease [Nocardiopsis suaedae]MDA2806474.1 serine protease [Nocardiopsis suaedae]
MPTAPVEAALVCVTDGSGAPVGAGFLVSEDHLVTCAHVVSSALGTGPHALPAAGAQIPVVFPLLAPGTRLQAVVARTGGGGGRLADDHALLRITGPLPSGAQPVRLVTGPDLSGLDVRAGGFPRGLNGAPAWARCTILGRSATEVVQTEDVRTSGIAIQPGFSGGPLWSDGLHGVVGMTLAVAPRREARTSYALTGRALFDALPELAERAMPPNPYRGLDPFRSKDGRLFFGREEMVEELVDLVARRENVLLVGPSGCGKTSLIHAGLLFREPLPDPEGVFVIRPGEADAAARTDAALARDDRTLIVVDQAEEAVTTGAVGLAARITAAASRPSSPVQALFSVRSDFLDALLSLRETADLASWRTRSVPALPEAGLRRAVVGPLPPGVVFENGLVERILEAVRDARAPLPLLQFTLSRLWEEQRSGVIGHRAYDDIGGVPGALDGYAEEVWALLGPEERSVAPRLFGRLVRVRRGHAPTARSAPLAELGPAERRFTLLPSAARLIVTENAAGRAVVRPAHEALITHWARLRNWVRDDARFLFWREEFRADTDRWRRSGQDESLLLRGAALAQAEGWARERRAELTGEELDYLTASGALRLRQRRRSRRIVATVSALLALALVVGVVAEAQRRRAEQEEANAASQTLAEDLLGRTGLDETLVLHAVAAYRTAPTQRATDALFDTYARTRDLDALVSAGGVLASGAHEPAASTDLSWIGTVANLRVHTWNRTDDGFTEGPLTGETASRIAISADGTTAALLEDHRVTLHDRQGRRVGVVDVPDGGVVDSPQPITLSPSGDYLAVHELNLSLEIAVYDTDTGERVTGKQVEDDVGAFVLSDEALFISSGDRVEIHGLTEGSTETIDLPGFGLDREGNQVASSVSAGPEGSVHAACRQGADRWRSRIHTRRPALDGTAAVVKAPIACDESFAPAPDGHLAVGRHPVSGEGDEKGDQDTPPLRFVDLRGGGLIGGSALPAKAERHRIAPADEEGVRVIGWNEEVDSIRSAEYRLGRMDTTPGIRVGDLSARYAATVRTENGTLKGAGVDLWNADDLTHISHASVRGTMRVSLFKDLLVIEAKGRVQVRTTPDLEILWEHELPESEWPRAVPSFDERYLIVAAEDGMTSVHRIRTGETTGEPFSLPRPTPDYGLGPVSPSTPLLQPVSEGELMAISEDTRSLERWDWRTGERTDTIELPGDASLVSFAPVPGTGGRDFAFFRREKTVERNLEIWRITDGDATRVEVLTTGVWESFFPVRMSGEGDFGIQDGKRMGIWQVDGEGGEQVLDLPVPEGMAPVAADLDSRSLMADGPMGGVAVYSLDPERWLSHLCGLVGGRGMSEPETRNLPPGVRTDDLC